MRVGMIHAAHSAVGPVPVSFVSSVTSVSSASNTIAHCGAIPRMGTIGAIVWACPPNGYFHRFALVRAPFFGNHSWKG